MDWSSTAPVRLTANRTSADREPAWPARLFPFCGISCRSILLRKSRRGGMADAEDLKSSGGKPPCGFKSHRRYSTEPDRNRQNPANYGVKPSSPSAQSLPSSRQDTTDSASIRPPTATQNATHLLPDDPGLAAVVDAWPDLPEAIKAGIVAMVRAAVN